jgi:hypothetical protein
VIARSVSGNAVPSLVPAQRHPRAVMRQWRTPVGGRARKGSIGGNRWPSPAGVAALLRDPEPGAVHPAARQRSPAVQLAQVERRADEQHLLVECGLRASPGIGHAATAVELGDGSLGVGQAAGAHEDVGGAPAARTGGAASALVPYCLGIGAERGARRWP